MSYCSVSLGFCTVNSLLKCLFRFPPFGKSLSSSVTCLVDFPDLHDRFHYFSLGMQRPCPSHGCRARGQSHGTSSRLSPASRCLGPGRLAHALRSLPSRENTEESHARGPAGRQRGRRRSGRLTGTSLTTVTASSAPRMPPDPRPVHVPDLGSENWRHP